MGFSVGAVSEALGAIGVIITLVYLAGQIKQNTSGLKTSAYQMYNGRTDSFWDFEAQHASVLGPIYEEAISYEDLDSVQKLILDSSRMKAFNVLEALFLHHSSGAISDTEFKAKIEGFKVAFRHPTVYEAWQRLGNMAFTAQFHSFMNDEVFHDWQSDKRSWLYGFKKDEATDK